MYSLSKASCMVSPFATLYKDPSGFAIDSSAKQHGLNSPSAVVSMLIQGRAHMLDIKHFFQFWKNFLSSLTASLIQQSGVFSKLVQIFCVVCSCHHIDA